MKESGKNAWQLKKAYEIAYAAYRIATKLNEQDFAGHLKSAGISVLGAAAAGDYINTRKRLVSLEYLIRFAMDVNIMGITNGEIMLREIQGLDESLNSSASESKSGNDVNDRNEADIAGIFSEVDSIEPTGIRQEVVRQNDESGNDAESGKVSSGGGGGGGNGNGNGSGGNGEIGGILKSAIRQSAILERIRQVGNCRMKDIQEILPDTSERTIRYDLQTMVEQDLIDRVGVGGPAVYYRIRQASG